MRTSRNETDRPGVGKPGRRSAGLEFRALLGAIREDDDGSVEDALVALSRTHRIFAPLALAVSALAMLIEGLRLLLSNWRLTLVEVLSAMWIWAAMLDLKLHLLRGRSFRDFHGVILVPLIAAIVVITTACFFLNAVFAFAVAGPGPPKIRSAFSQAWAHPLVIGVYGVLTGLALGAATIVFPRWGLLWFSISLSIVVGLMMITYVAVPARLIGARASSSRRDSLTATAIGGVLGAAVSTPGYLLGRAGILMLGSHVLFVPGILVLSFGATLQAGATGAVKAVKMSAKLVAGHQSADADRDRSPQP